MGRTVAELRPDLSPAFAARLGINPKKPLTTDVIANLLNATQADGSVIAGRKKHSATRSVTEGQIHETRAPVGFIDITFSAPKSLSAAWALAPTAHERDLLNSIHHQAVADTMRYVETQLGYVQRGGAENRYTEAVAEFFQRGFAEAVDRETDAPVAFDHKQ